MNAVELYNMLDEEFNIDKIGAEGWSMKEVEEFVAPSFKKRNEGILFDFAAEIQKVYSITFPDPTIIRSILCSGEQNILIFSHHAQMEVVEKKNQIWDIRMENLPVQMIERMQKQNIALYSLHIPLDNYGEYSTGNNFAKRINLNPEKGCCLYVDALTGVIGKAPIATISAYTPIINNCIGHEVKVYNYGTDEIRNSRAGIVTGWGVDIEVLEEMYEEDINTFITGFTNKIPDIENLVKAHEYARKKKINLIGTTHYSSEKFACMAMTKYFQKFGLPCVFVEGRYNLNDL